MFVTVPKAQRKMPMNRQVELEGCKGREKEQSGQVPRRPKPEALNPKPYALSPKP